MKTRRIAAISLALVMMFSLCSCKLPFGNIIEKGRSIIGNIIPGSAENSKKPALELREKVELDRSAFPEGTVFSIEQLGSDSDTVRNLQGAIQNTVSVVAYDITATCDNAAVQPNGFTMIYFPFPEGFDPEKHDAVVHYVASDGMIEAVSTVVGSGDIKAAVSHLSVYAIITTLKDWGVEEISPDFGITGDTESQNPYNDRVPEIGTEDNNKIEITVPEQVAPEIDIRPEKEERPKVDVEPEMTVIPDIRNYDMSTAQKILRANGLSWNIIYQSHDTLPANFVIETNPDSGTVARGSVIDVYVSMGPDVF